MRTRTREGESVVLLNASFEPLGIVPLSRALVFLMRERAVLVDAVPGRTVRSAEAEFPMPRVVQFRELVRVPYRYGTVPWTRRGLLERDGHECVFCGKRASSVDHLTPKARGGRDTWGNTAAACLSCNSKKGCRTPEEAGMPLRFQPRVVTSRETLVLAIAAIGADVAALGLAVPA